MTEYKSIVNVDSAYYALIEQDNDAGYVVGTPKRLAPAMELKGASESSSETQYADGEVNDIVGAEGPTKFEIKLPSLPEDTASELLGSVYDTATGRFFDDADPAQAPFFALGYRFKKSNGKYRYRWYLRCRAEKPDEEGMSESDKVSLGTTTLKIVAVKTMHKFDLKGDGSRVKSVKRVHGDEEIVNFDGATWFNAVQTPVAGTPGAFSVTPVPADGATGVSVSANLTLTFSNPLAGGREAGITLINLDAQAPVAVARTINAERTVVTLNPNSDLSASTDYAIIVHDVVDIHGQALADTVINFTTA